MASLLGVLPSEVYFTSGGTEADNWAIRGLGQGKAAASPIEHAAVISSLFLRKEGGMYGTVGADGIVRTGDFGGTMSENIGLYAVMVVNNETGCVQPIAELADFAHERGALLFSDCVQAAATQDLRGILRYADAVSLSAHKIGGPKGTGALIVKRGKRLRPLIAGGEQERGLRGGTLNVAGIVGFARALGLAQGERETFCSHAARLQGLFEKLVKEGLGDLVRIDGERRAPNISHLTFREAGIVDRLDLEGIACSAGAACSAHARKPSHVLLAMGRSEQEAERGARFSFGRETTEEDVRTCARILCSLLG